jgi:hypothetical protein
MSPRFVRFDGRRTRIDERPPRRVRVDLRLAVSALDIAIEVLERRVVAAIGAVVFRPTVRTRCSHRHRLAPARPGDAAPGGRRADVAWPLGPLVAVGVPAPERDETRAGWILDLADARWPRLIEWAPGQGLRVPAKRIRDLASDEAILGAVAALEHCARECRECASRSAEDDPLRLATCVATCEACADICDATAVVLRETPVSRLEIVVGQLRSAYEATRTCAVECAEYPDDACQRCAEVCAETRDIVKELLATVEDEAATVGAPRVRDVPRRDD